MPEKLVRDKIPFIISKAGGKPLFRKATKTQYQKKLKEKLQEEVEEFLQSNKTEELADILEVIFALAWLQKISPKKIEKLRNKKAQKRGAFSKRFLLKI